MSARLAAITVTLCVFARLAYAGPTDAEAKAAFYTIAE